MNEKRVGLIERCDIDCFPVRGACVVRLTVRLLLRGCFHAAGLSRPRVRLSEPSSFLPFHLLDPTIDPSTHISPSQPSPLIRPPSPSPSTPLRTFISYSTILEARGETGDFIVRAPEAALDNSARLRRLFCTKLCRRNFRFCTGFKVSGQSL